MESNLDRFESLEVDRITKACSHLTGFFAQWRDVSFILLSFYSPQYVSALHPSQSLYRLVSLLCYHQQHLTEMQEAISSSLEVIRNIDSTPDIAAFIKANKTKKQVAPLTTYRTLLRVCASPNFQFMYPSHPFTRSLIHSLSVFLTVSASRR